MTELFAFFVLVAAVLATSFFVDHIVGIVLGIAAVFVCVLWWRDMHR